MLVLSRKLNEAIILLDGQVRIVILSVQGDQVKLGIDAPREIAVLREEIHLAQLENQRASDPPSPDALSAFTDLDSAAPFHPPKPKSP